MGLVDLFTNADQPEVDIKSPAFSLTKVQAGIGALITAVLTGRRAAEAKLRYGGNGGGSDDNGEAPEHFFAIPDVDDLQLQVGPGADEYKIYVAEVEGEKVRLHAQRDGECMRKSFTRPS